jgi:hypothetical protein
MVPSQGIAPTLTGCPRPSDQYGPRYQTVTGALMARRTTPGGGKFVVIKTPSAAAPQAETVTDAVFDRLGSVPPGTLITFFSYTHASMSGAHPPYSCVELADHTP